MFHAIKGGSEETIQGFVCQLPPVGYGKNRITGKLEYVGVVENAHDPKDQKWKRIELLPEWDKRRKKEAAEQEGNPDYFDPDLEQVRERHWLYRLCGMWVKIRGKNVFIPPSYYLYLNWCPLDVGFPAYRDTDRRFFYVWEYCCEDPRCAGLVDIERRRMGKTYKSGSILLDRTSLHKNHHGGIQSKTAPDAKQVFLKTVVTFFKKFPDFFRPVYDASKGMTPTSELRFFQTARKGRNAEKILEGRELESWIDWGSSEPFHYDGSKLNTYVMDEFGKCFTKDTSVLMHGGIVKKVQDIKNGELVMGDDSTARTVYGVTNGTEQMYEIIPKSGEAFGCNESHVLSLKWANRDWHYNGWQFNDTINISVGRFLQLPAQAKKHLMLWRVGVEYPEQQHLLDPYYLGAWLGDGSAKSAGFSSGDAEVIQYISNYAGQMGARFIKIPESYDYRISGTQGRVANPILNALKTYGIISNKHIPHEYLIDSEKNRLELLAGLLDADGHLFFRNNKPAGYEITQKRERLAIEITTLARSLGFKATKVKKVATMVRADGTIYKCPVYRICIFGDLFRIPCKVKRKQAQKFEYHKNRRNPLRTGFAVKPTGKGEYFGFAVDGNHLFLLADYTVVHNTMECNTWDRWNVVRFCLDQDGHWCGKALLTSTIEEMENGGENARKIWESSNPNERDDNGRTKSGLYRFFLPAFETTFFDEYGMPEVKKAKEYYLAQRAGLQSDPRALSSIIRKNPFTIEEAFRIDGDRCLYDAMKLNLQLDNISYKNSLTERGNFMWENGERFTRVKWEKSANGRWEITTLLSSEESNKVVCRNGNYFPNNNAACTMGVDPFKYDAAKDQRRSDCAALVYRKFNSFKSDDPYNDAFVCKYKYRASTTAVQYEDLLKTAWYYGCQILFERNVDNWRHYFKEANCENFLMRLPGEDDYGVYSDGKKIIHQLLCDYTEAYIDEHIEKVFFKDLIREWLEFDIDKTTAYDLAMAAGYTLIAAREKLYKRTVMETRDVGDYFRIYKAV